jgi:ubiquinone/menaquinone biosynthesis C-methylase UbiE
MQMSSIDIDALYRFRFANVKQGSKDAVWSRIARFLQRKHFHGAKRILDPAAGRGEFLRHVTAEERWAVDLADQYKKWSEEGIKFSEGDFFDVDLPRDYFDGVFVSNLLEHLPSVEGIQDFLKRVRAVLRPGGKVVIMGPNFSHCYREYFDFMDHKIPLTEKSVAEHLAAAGFTIESITPQFLPYTFTGRLPAFPFLVDLYLAMPFAWRVLGKQFLVAGTKSF